MVGRDKGATDEDEEGVEEEEEAGREEVTGMIDSGTVTDATDVAAVVETADESGDSIPLCF